MSTRCQKGKGIPVPNDPIRRGEVFYSQANHDWLLVCFNNGEGRWFGGYRNMLRFMRVMGYTGKITKEMALA